MLELVAVPVPEDEEEVEAVLEEEEVDEPPDVEVEDAILWGVSGG